MRSLNDIKHGAGGPLSNEELAALCRVFEEVDPSRDCCAIPLDCVMVGERGWALPSESWVRRTLEDIGVHVHSDTPLKAIDYQDAYKTWHEAHTVLTELQELLGGNLEGRELIGAVKMLLRLTPPAALPTR